MKVGVGSFIDDIYQRVLEQELTETPNHIAIIQDGNRRYARKNGQTKPDGYRAGAQTTEAVLDWCHELGVEEVTLYAFSTENFNRPSEEQETLFELITDRLRSFADDETIHDREVRIQAIGETHRLPAEVQDAIVYAEERTAAYDALQLNVALAYGGRAELLNVARNIATEADKGTLQPETIDTSEVTNRLKTAPTQPVDLIVRTGGDKRTSNFLPWQANGNEAAVYFTSPYWPEFSRVDFLRAIRTYNARTDSWQQTRIHRIKTFTQALIARTSETVHQLRDRLVRPIAATKQTEADPPEQSSKGAD